MNERIKQLLNQAGIYQPDRFDAIDGSNQMEKFAELIVRECAEVCLAQRDPANLNYKPSVKFAEAVKEHFGVKR
jgi:hypothetical protein